MGSWVLVSDSAILRPRIQQSVAEAQINKGHLTIVVNIFLRRIVLFTNVGKFDVD